ncbi:hypothetical protein H6P81_018919 [Aristolochia fimbriata]|uniref:Uncharacterized protein n=1 Tax=Aristolochia fimbriata TaxID=158543 RepID=A0AAV7E4L3_ARIFI|nr:hypothetical protein H6P81_018919 [Aristolochia fimbriata]
MNKGAPLSSNWHSNARIPVHLADPKGEDMVLVKEVLSQIKLPIELVEPKGIFNIYVKQGQAKGYTRCFLVPNFEQLQTVKVLLEPRFQIISWIQGIPVTPLARPRLSEVGFATIRKALGEQNVTRLYGCRIFYTEKSREQENWVMLRENKPKNKGNQLIQCYAHGDTKIGCQFYPSFPFRVQDTGGPLGEMSEPEKEIMIKEEKNL